MLTSHTAGQDHRNSPHKKTRLRLSNLFCQTVAAVSVLELLGNRQRPEPELLVNKTAVGETEAEPATHPHRKQIGRNGKSAQHHV